MNWLSSRLRYSNVMSTIAVFVALGGASYAAVTLPQNSVGTKQIKNGQVKHADLGKNAVTSTNVKDGSLLSADFKAGQIPAGPQGPIGPAGQAGPKGDKGDRGPSNAVGTTTSGNVQIGVSTSAPVTIASLTLGAGNWVLMAETGLTNVSGATRSAWCTLNNGATELGRTRAFDIAAGTQRSGDATVLGQVALPSGGTITFECFADGASVFTPSQSSPSMEAIQVGSLG